MTYTVFAELMGDRANRRPPGDGKLILVCSFDTEVGALAKAARFNEQSGYGPYRNAIIVRTTGPSIPSIKPVQFVAQLPPPAYSLGPWR